MFHRLLYRSLGRFLKRYDRRHLGSKILLKDSFDYSIRNATYVNSRSILFSCSIHPDNPQSSIVNSTYLDSIPQKLSDFQSSNISKKSPTIFVASDGIAYFAQHILSKIRTPFILVTGDSDLPINTVSLGDCLKILLDSPMLVSWFCQNRDIDHPKLFSLPIGINIHNLWSNPLEWGGGFILPVMQELQLTTLAQTAPNFATREPKIFCNWHFSIDRADRRQCLEMIDHSLCHFQEKPLPMASTWELQSQFQYVLSPHGAGVDCHRTWEALLLGCVPIIKKSSIDDLFTDLPVITVDDWDEIHPGFLDRATAELEKKTINTEKLYMNYWKSRIKT
jgi:hypothetical protein